MIISAAGSIISAAAAMELLGPLGMYQLNNKWTDTHNLS